MRKIILSVALLIGIISAKAQQLHFMSQYLQYNSMYNPANAGLSENNTLGVSYRNMWNSFPGNPKTTMVYGDFDLKNMNAGVATYLYRDETGPTSRTGIQLAYSYHINTGSEKNKLAVGLEVRGLQYAIDKTKLSESLGSDPVLSGASNKTAFDAGFGVAWTNSKLSIGAAASQLIESKLQFADVPNIQQSGKLYRHYNLIGSYKIQTGEDIYIIPNVMARMIEHAPNEYEFGAKVDYQDKIWWALNWRVNQLWSVQTGFKLFQKVRASYSYDYYNTPMGVFNAGSGAHEIGLQFNLKNN